MVQCHRHKHGCRRHVSQQDTGSQKRSWGDVSLVRSQRKGGLVEQWFWATLLQPVARRERDLGVSARPGDDRAAGRCVRPVWKPGRRCSLPLQRQRAMATNLLYCDRQCSEEEEPGSHAHIQFNNPSLYLPLVLDRSTGSAQLAPPKIPAVTMPQPINGSNPSLYLHPISLSFFHSGGEKESQALLRCIKINL